MNPKTPAPREVARDATPTIFERTCKHLIINLFDFLLNPDSLDL